MARRTSKTTGKKKNGLKVDFSGVETRILLPEGIYQASVAEIKQEEGQKGNYLAWKFLTVDDDPKLNGKPLYNNTSLLPQSLWVLGSLLETLGVERPDGPMDIDFDELIGLELNLTVEHEEYQGKPRSKVVDFSPVTDDDDEDGDAIEVEDDEGEGDAYTTDEINEMDAEALGDVVEANDLGVKAVKKLATYRAKVLAALEKAELLNDEEEEGEEEAEDDGDEEEVDGYTEEEVLGMDADELAEVVKTNNLEVKVVKKLSKYRAAVVAALEEAGLIGEEGEAEDDGDEEEVDGYTEEEINEMDAKQLAAVVEENDLDVKPLKKIAKYRSAVIDALEEAELLAEEA